MGDSFARGMKRRRDREARKRARREMRGERGEAAHFTSLRDGGDEGNPGVRQKGAAVASADDGMVTVWHGTSRLCGELIWRDKEFHYPLYVSTLKSYARAHAIAATACDLDRGGDKRYVIFEFEVPDEALVTDPDGNADSYVYACPPGGMDVTRIDGNAREQLSERWRVNAYKLKGLARSLQPMRDAGLDLEDAEA